MALPRWEFWFTTVDPDTFNGAFVFGGGLAPVLGDGTQQTAISGLEQYRRTLLGLPGGVPTTYNITQGTALVPFTQWRVSGDGQQWTTISAPKTLTAGAEWKLKSQDGLGCTLRVQALAGDHATILDTDDHLPGRTVAIEATWTNSAWSIDKMHYSAVGADANQGLTITFVPGATATGALSKFEVIAGRKTRIASGTVHGDPTQARVGWEFKDPDWLRGKTAWVKSAVVSQRPAGAETASK